MTQVSMLITTYNRGGLLRNSLTRLRELTLPDEILVIDDGGEDETESVCQEFGDLPIRYIYNRNPGSTICSMARNIGIKEATHDWIVTCEPELIYLTDVIAQFNALRQEPVHQGKVISTGVVYFAPEGWDGSGVAGLATAGDYQPPSGSQEAIGWVAPYSAIWYRPWLLEIGGWDESFPGYWGWDDIDLLTRLRYSGHDQYIALDVKGVHQFHGLGGDDDFINEKHFFSKSFNHGHEKHILCPPECPEVPDDPSDLVANKGKDWGRVI